MGKEENKYEWGKEWVGQEHLSWCLGITSRRGGTEHATQRKQCKRDRVNV